MQLEEEEKLLLLACEEKQTDVMSLLVLEKTLDQFKKAGIEAGIGKDYESDMDIQKEDPVFSLDD